VAPARAVRADLIPDVAAARGAEQLTGVLPVPVTGSLPGVEPLPVVDAAAAGGGPAAAARSALGRTWGRIRPMLHSDGE
jgi:hypothetical protein